MDRSDKGPALKHTERSKRAGMDRLSRSLEDVLPIRERVRGAGGGLRSLTENIGTAALAGSTMMRRVGNLADFECV